MIINYAIKKILCPNILKILHFSVSSLVYSFLSVILFKFIVACGIKL